MVIFRNSNYAVMSDLSVVNVLTGRKLKPFKKKNGYVQICLYIDKCKQYFYLHRVIAECLIPNPEGKKEINHIDGNPSNNDITNLEWVTSSENQKHAFLTGLQKPTKLFDVKSGVYKGVIHYKPAIGGEVKTIRALTDCKHFGFNSASVHKVINGQLKTHKGFVFWR